MKNKSSLECMQYLIEHGLYKKTCELPKLNETIKIFNKHASPLGLTGGVDLQSQLKNLQEECDQGQIQNVLGFLLHSAWYDALRGSEIVSIIAKKVRAIMSKTDGLKIRWSFVMEMYTVIPGDTKNVQFISYLRETLTAHEQHCAPDPFIGALSMHIYQAVMDKTRLKSLDDFLELEATVHEVAFKEANSLTGLDLDVELAVKRQKSHG